MRNPLRFLAVPAATLAAAELALAQESAAGNAIADQLAESSLRMVGSMFVVLVLVALCAWVLRRWRDRQGAGSGSIEIVSGITLGSKERIVLVQVGAEQVLVGAGPAGMRTLHVLSRPVETATESKPNGVESAAARPSSPPADFKLSLGAAK